MRASRNGSVAGLALAVLVLLPPSAVGDYKSGRYSGRGGHALTIGFSAAKKQIKKLKFKFYTPNASCTDGQAFGGDQKPYPTDPIPIKKGKFKVALESDPQYSPATARITGTLRGTHASGTFRLTLHFSDGVTCESGKRKWKARLT